jgi:hypothetical protein
MELATKEEGGGFFRPVTGNIGESGRVEKRKSARSACERQR